jgi:hypothetical protein
MEKIMLNPWIFGLEAMQQGWQAQTAMALTLMRSFGASASDQSTSSPLIQETVVLEAQEEAPAAIAVEQEAPAAVAHVRRRKAPTVLRVSKKLSRAKPPSASKRAAAASKKAVRRSDRTNFTKRTKAPNA